MHAKQVGARSRRRHLFKRLRAAEQWLRWLAEQLWQRQSALITNTDYRVRAVDATTVQEQGATGTDWRVHFVINLRDLQCDHFELTDVKGGETFRRIPIEQGDLLLGDRAYGTARHQSRCASRRRRIGPCE